MGDNKGRAKWLDPKYVLSVLLTALTIGFLLWDRFSTSPYKNIAIVVDSSLEMKKQFDTTTKAVAAIKILKEKYHNIVDDDNLALILFGGSCDPIEPEPKIRFEGFDQKNKEKIINILIARFERDSLWKEPMLQSGVIHAISELKQLKGDKKIIVIAGGAAPCQGNAAEKIRKRLIEDDPNGEISRDIHFIGLKVPRHQRQQFREIAEATGEGKALFADNDKELQFSFDEPSLANDYFIAKEYRLYHGGNKDAEAARLLEELAGKGRGNPTLPYWAAMAMRYLGDIYQDKYQEPIDLKKAAAWYAEAAQAGNVTACARLVAMFLLKQEEGEKYKDDAFTWLSQAANSAEADCETKYTLGKAYDSTIWGPNLPLAVDWYKKALNECQKAPEENADRITESQKRIDDIEKHHLTVK